MKKDNQIIRLPKNIWVRRFLFLLAAGISLGLTTNPRNHIKLFKTLPKEWKKINRSHIYRLSHSLKRRGYIKYNRSGELIRIIITDAGKKYLKRLEVNDLELPKNASWDGVWHVILFDIPEEKKRIRDALRRKLKELGCIEVQKSVFAWPYNCRKEIQFVIDFFDIHDNVIYSESKISNDEKLRKYFNLSQ